MIYGKQLIPFESPQTPVTPEPVSRRIDKVKTGLVNIVATANNIAPDLEIPPMYMTRYPVGNVAVEQVAVPQSIREVAGTHRPVQDEKPSFIIPQEDVDKTFGGMIAANYTQQELDRLAEIRDDLDHIPRTSLPEDLENK